MNKVMTKYIVKELLMYYAISFLFFFMVFFVNQILLMVQDVLKQRAPIGDVLKLMLYCLPFVISQSAPFATLVGFLMCIGRMVSDNEILVLRALGLSYGTILVPVLIVGAIISVFSFAVDDMLVPRGALAYNNLYRKMLFSNPGVELESNSIKRTQDSLLVIGEVEGTNVSDLLYFDFDSEGNQRIIACDSAEILQSSDSAVLMQIDMQNALIFLPQAGNARSIDFINSKSTFLNVFSSSFSSINSGINPREMTAYDVKKYIAGLKAQGDYDPVYINAFEVEYFRKFAVPFGSIFFAFLAFPLAIMFGKHNGQTIGFAVGVVICVAYWSLQMIGQVFGQRNGLNGFWAMWLPDILVGVGAAAFYLRMRRA